MIYTHVANLGAGVRSPLVTLNIYNLLGEKIKTLVKQEQAKGKYQINFDGNNLPSGIYFYQLKTDKFQQTKKMLLLR